MKTGDGQNALAWVKVTALLVAGFLIGYLLWKLWNLSGNIADAFRKLWNTIIDGLKTFFTFRDGGAFGMSGTGSGKAGTSALKPLTPVDFASEFGGMESMDGTAILEPTKPGGVRMSEAEYAWYKQNGVPLPGGFRDFGTYAESDGGATGPLDIEIRGAG